jgi:transcriptional regulator with XRE-family HTH domain
MSEYVSWSEVRAKTPHDETQVERLTKKYLAKSRVATLTDIRLALGFTQEDLAQIIGVNQSNISRIEKGQLTKTEFQSLYSYVEALGGKIEVHAKFGANSLQIVDSSYEEELKKKPKKKKPRRR